MLKIPQKAYKYASFQENAVNEKKGEKTFEIKGLKTDREILVELGEMDYRPFCSQEMLSAINAFKASIVAIFQTLNPLYILKPNKIIKHLNRVGSKSVKYHILYRKHQSAFEKELFLLLVVFLQEIGVEKDNAKEFSEYLAYILANDSAYRSVIQDLLCETSIEKLSNPVRELKRLLNLAISRNWNLDYRHRKMFNIGVMILALPRARRALNQSLKSIVWDNLLPDEIDKYWWSYRDDYLFMGKTQKQRHELYVKIKK